MTLALERARAGRRARGRRLRPARQARAALHRLVAARAASRRSGSAGQNGIALRARGLRPGRYRVVLTAADGVGNRSPRRTLGAAGREAAALEVDAAHQVRHRHGLG